MLPLSRFIKKTLCKWGENSFGDNKMCAQFPPPLNSIRENFLGVDALTTRYSPYIQKLGCIEGLSIQLGAPSNWVH